MLRDLGRDDPQIAATVAVILSVRPDILVLTDFDFDLDLVALGAFQARLEAAGLDIPYAFANTPNAGMATDLDLDQNGYTGEARDAQGYGRFAGDGGMAILSRWPIGEVRDLSDILWTDLPGAVLPPMPDEVAAVQRLSSTAHWIVPINAPDGAVNILAYSATPPVFDGPEDRNGLRNRDELRLWQLVLDGVYGPPPDFVIAGNANLDPSDGQGLRAAMADFLADPRITDPRPESPGGLVAADPLHLGDPSLDTADWPDERPGNLRVSYVLPAASFDVQAAGVVWPDPDQGQGQTGSLSEAVQAAGPHRLVWVEVSR